MINNKPNSSNTQRGAALLAAVTMVALILVMVQGTMYYNAHSSYKFSSSEKTKIQAQQIAEAGIDMNVSDIGNKKIKLVGNLLNYITYNNQNIGNGSFTTKITTITHSELSDVIDVFSTGDINGIKRDIVVRMRIIKVINNTIDKKLGIHSDTTVTYRIHKDSDIDNEQNNCNKSNTNDDKICQKNDDIETNNNHKVSVCHIPPGNPSNFHTLIVGSSAVSAHLDHGDILGECNKTGPEKLDTVFTINNIIRFDSTIVSDTTMKSQVISWKE